MNNSQDFISSSPESLIFSQETFQDVWNGVAQDLHGVDLNTLDSNCANDQETNEITEQQSNLPYSTFNVDEEVVEVTEEQKSALELTNVLSTIIQVPDSLEPQKKDSTSLPAIQNWSGNCGFNVTFPPQNKCPKGISWTYSPLNEKLYVAKDVACPINFSTSCIMPEGTYIRAMPLFKYPAHVSHLVHRCYHHQNIDLEKGLQYVDHLIRCECESALYQNDSVTERQSVVVPFDNPPAGQYFSTYIFKFLCFGSCSGGPNRRPLMIIFTLEKGNQVIGRKKFDLKICACPTRDRRSEEDQALAKTTQQRNISLKRKEPSQGSDNFKVLDFMKGIKLPPMKKIKAVPNKDGLYVINVKDEKMYNFLKSMKFLYEACSMFRNVPTEIASKLFEHAERRDTESD